MGNTIHQFTNIVIYQLLFPLLFIIIMIIIIIIIIIIITIIVIIIIIKNQCNNLVLLRSKGLKIIL